MESPSTYDSGKAYYLRGDYTTAITTLQNYIDENIEIPSERSACALAYDCMGQCYAALDSDTEANDCYEKAVRLDDTCASAWHNRGLLSMKQAEQALDSSYHDRGLFLLGCARTHLVKALKLCSTMPMFLHSIASYYERYAEALAQFKQADEGTPQKIHTSFGHAISYYEKALAACDDDTLDKIFSSNFVECLAQYGHYFYRAGHYSDAQNYYKHALGLDPNHLSALNQMGMCSSREGDFKIARDYFHRIIEISSDDRETLADAWLNIGYTYRSEHAFEAATDAIKRAKELSPSDADILEEEQALLSAKAMASFIRSSQRLFSCTYNEAKLWAKRHESSKDQHDYDTSFGLTLIPR